MISGYLTESSLVLDPVKGELELSTALGLTPGGLVDHPHFFAGFLSRADIAAAALLTVADVAMTRYFDASIAGRTWDPVVTASGDRLRFESFSACNGVHARFDLLSGGIEAGEVGFGTTNVDINQPLRTALARMGRSALTHVTVGSELLVVSTVDDQHLERQVDLPDRWIRGFAETPAVAEQMSQVATVPGPAVPSFLSGLPSATPGPTVYFVPAPGGLRRSLRTTPGVIALAGTSRLSAATRIARWTTALDVYASPAGATGWVFHLPGARLTLLISPEPYRGFSGEGSLLRTLSQTHDDDLAAEDVADLLAWDPAIDPAALSSASGLELDRIRGGLSRLAASGLVGFDLAEQAWFHRELPIDPDRIHKDNPRLIAALELVAQGAVRRTGETWVVATDGHDQYVDGPVGAMRCSCIWWAKYLGQRGPCKHALAVELTLRGSVGSTD